LTNDILDITRIESQTLRLNKEQFNLNDVLLHIVNDYKNQAVKNRSPVTISYEPGQELSNGEQVVVADKERITQVISNLLDNAVKFTQAGTISVSAEVKREKAAATTGLTLGKEQMSASSGHILVRIEDTGSGIDPEIVTKLFSKFTTKSLKGTGLGLYISKSIIEAHGGKIWAKNNENIGIRNSSMSTYASRDSDQKVSAAKGATFYFTLPL
jgi:two-component system, OmpR family, sensor histidine kinase VicK